MLYSIAAVLPHSVHAKSTSVLMVQDEKMQEGWKLRMKADGLIPQKFMGV